MNHSELTHREAMVADHSSHFSVNSSKEAPVGPEAEAGTEKTLKLIYHFSPKMELKASYHIILRPVLYHHNKNHVK